MGESETISVWGSWCRFDAEKNGITHPPPPTTLAQVILLPFLWRHLFERLSLPIFARFSIHRECRLKAFLSDDIPQALDWNAEKLLSIVHLVHPKVVEMLVQHPLKGRRIVAANHGVDIESERHGGVAQFLDAVLGFQSPGHANLEHNLAE